MIAAFFAMVHPARAAIYKYTDQDGTIHFSDTPVAGALKVANDRRGGEHAGTFAGRQAAAGASSTRIEDLIKRKSMKYRIDPSLVKAVIRAESGFNCTAVSDKGAMGLMQLMPATAVSLGVYNPFDPAENIEGGVRYLSSLLQRFGGNLTLALAAYNAGPKYIEKYGVIPPYRETENYIRKVLSSYRGGAMCSLDGGDFRPGESPAGRSVSASRRPRIRKPTVIYKVALRDGTVLYTNTPPGF
ncbi:MAG: lytic transglycosylase domain-containing protein [Nitrospiraceae bacterium]|nr:lytic transglycosylase domain-containing protein [Nitrospiraceae bacterium]